MTLRVFTSHFTFRGPDRLNVARLTASEGLAFAPSWELLKRYLPKFRDLNLAKKGTKFWQHGSVERTEAQAWEEYKKRYTEEMSESYAYRRDHWDKLLAKERVVLVCYCVSRDRCHRGLLAGILATIGAEDCGELDHRTGKLPTQLRLV